MSSRKEHSFDIQMKNIEIGQDLMIPEVCGYCGHTRVLLDGDICEPCAIEAQRLYLKHEGQISNSLIGQILKNRHG